jgi:hypothetical protein
MLSFLLSNPEQATAQFFFRIEMIIFGSLMCAGLLIWGFRVLAKEIFDLYEECEERLKRRRGS